MIKVKVYWKGNEEEITIYTLKAFQAVFNQSNGFNMADNLNGNRIEFFVE
jgi:hypothetical protein